MLNDLRQSGPIKTEAILLLGGNHCPTLDREPQNWRGQQRQGELLQHQHSGGSNVDAFYMARCSDLFCQQTDGTQNKARQSRFLLTETLWYKNEDSEVSHLAVLVKHGKGTR